MDGQLQSISKIFTEKLFRIPDYQRGYAWRERQLKDFWNDIIQLEENKNHYVGVLTLEPVRNEIYNQWKDDKWIIDSKNFEPFYIVDGQQRLTTTIILIQAITESISNKAKLNYSTIEEIKKRYIFDSKNGGISRSYIFGYEKDNPSYEFLKTFIFNENSTSGYSKEITIYTHNLSFAKEFFQEKLSNLTNKQKEVIFKKVTQNFLFNIYSISSDIDVFVSFETMNNRGKALSNLELLKNRLIYLSTKFDVEPSEKSHLRKIINDGWKGIYHYLGKNKEVPLSDDEFLHNHLILYYGTEIYKRDEDFELLIKKRIGLNPTFLNDFLLDQKFSYRNLIDKNGQLSVDSVKAYVESLQQSVIIWFNLHNPTICEQYCDQEKLLLDKIYRLGLPRFSSLLLAFYLKKPKSEARIEFLKVLERFAFVNMLFYNRMYRINLNFSLIAIQIFNGKLSVKNFLNKIEKMTLELLENTEFFDRMIDSFKSDGFYNWYGIRYFLYEYEVSLREKSKSKTNKINWTEYNNEKSDFISIEHIYPQTPKAACWKEDFNSFGIRQRRILNNSLGNLLPLSKPKNSSLQNKCFLEKVDNLENPIGFRYGSYSENEISGMKSWTPQDILIRGMKLLDFMEKQWGLNFISNEKKIEMLGLKFISTAEHLEK